MEPSEGKTIFYSFVDNVLDGNRGNKLNSIIFKALTKAKENIKIYGFYVFNREIPSQEIFIQNDTHKLGIDLLWGGALSYLEDLFRRFQLTVRLKLIPMQVNAIMQNPLITM